MTLKEKLFRDSIGEELANLLQRDAPDMYAEELEWFRVPDFVLVDQFGKEIYSPDMADEDVDKISPEVLSRL